MPNPFYPNKPFLLIFLQILPKMAQMLPILLLFLATFTPKATADEPGLLTVTVDPEYISLSNVRRFYVYLMQAKGDNEFEDCEDTTVSLADPIEFMLDWSKCPRAVENPEQLQHLQIQIDVVYKGGRGQQQMLIKLEDYSHEFYSRVFGGGKAKLVAGESKESPKIEPEDPTAGTTSQIHAQQHAGASSSTHAHALQLVPNDKPGPLKITVDPEYISNVRQFNVYLVQAREENKYHFDACANPTLLSTNPVEFTLDWSKCPRPVERPEQLYYMHIKIEYKRWGQQQPNYTSIDLNNYSAGFYRRVFGGGKARLVKFFLTVEDKPKEFPRLVYLEDPIGTPIPPAGTATFNMEYQHRTVSSIRYFSVTHPTNFKEEMGECQPKNVEMSGNGVKFALDLAKCNVHDMADLLELHMDLRVALQKGQYPNRVEGRTEFVVFKTMAGQPDDVLRQLYSGAHQMNILLSEQYKPMLSLNGQHWADIRESSSAGTSSHPHQHAIASSSSHANALQLVPKTQEELTAQVESAGYYEGRKTPSQIAFWIPSKFLEGGTPRVVEYNGRLIIVTGREAHLVNDEQHKMRIWHADGDECPVEIAGPFGGRGISAVLKIDWTKCTPKPLKSHEELEGMEIVVYYRLDEDEPKEICHTFKQDEPLQSFFTGPHRSVGRLEVFEDGSVVFKQNG